MPANFTTLPGYTDWETKQAKGIPADLVLAAESYYEMAGQIARQGLATAYNLEAVSDVLIKAQEDQPKTQIYYDDRPIGIPLAALLQLGGKDIPPDIVALQNQVDFYRLEVGFNVQLPFEGGEQVEALMLRIDLDPSREIEDTRLAVHSTLPPTEFVDRLPRDKLEAIDVLVTSSLALIPKIPQVALIEGLLKLPSKILAVFPWKVMRMMSGGANSALAFWRIGYQRIAGAVPFTFVMRVPKGTKQIVMAYSGFAKIDTSRWSGGRTYQLRQAVVKVPLP